MYTRYLSLVLYVSICCPLSESARILGLFPTPYTSHQMTFRKLTTALSKRGHEMVIFTPNPINDPIMKNYTEIDLSFLHEIKKNKINFVDLKLDGGWNFIRTFSQVQAVVVEELYAHPVFQQLVKNNSTEKFDLILMQYLCTDGLLALSLVFDAPVITVISHNPLASHTYLIGNPFNVASTPNYFSKYSDDMNIWQRAVNLYAEVRDVFHHFLVWIPNQDKLVKKYLGDNFPSARELVSKNSMFFIYMHPFFAYPRPNVPAVLYFGGYHKISDMKTLPKDVKNFLDNATEGFIYFSMGSNAESRMFPEDMRNVFLSTFAELPYRVIWKFEDYLPNKPDNVFTMKWFPQTKILEHPNILLFMYQGGLQSTEEAIYNHVPLLGFPLVSDQNQNLRRLEDFGAAKALNIFTIDKDTLKNAIVEVATNSSYKEQVKKLDNLLKDLPYDPLDNAVWWTEHVIRHKGAPHLYNKNRELPFYSRELLDVLALFFSALALFLYLAFLILRCLLKILLHKTSIISRNDNEKTLKKKKTL